MILWILAYYQWYTNKSFKDIHKEISMVQVEKLYPTLHEASEEKFVATVNEIISRKKSIMNLQQLRRLAGYSQRHLASKLQVNIRNIQQYEQGVKDINKAAGETLYALSKAFVYRIWKIKG